MTYCAVLPAGMDLSAACADFAETAEYPDNDGTAGECAATLIENGREIGQQRMVTDSPAQARD